MSKSIRGRLTLTVGGILLAVLGLVLLLNGLLLRPYYLNHKQKAVTGAYDRLAAAASRTDQTDEERKAALEEIVQSVYESDNINSAVLGRSGYSFYVTASNNAEAMLDRLLSYEYLSLRQQPYPEGTQVLEADGDCHLVITPASGARGSYIECWGVLGTSGMPFILSAALESMRESVALSQHFFVLTGLIATLLGMILIYLTSRRMMRPVEQLSRISTKLADLDFSERYEGRERDEIGVLGTNMNRMADALQETVGELKAANEQLSRDLEKQTQIDDMRRDFLNNVSHELKTPIALIQGYAEGLADDVTSDPESRAYYCHVIMDEAEKMNRMVRQLLTLNHLEAGTSAPEAVRFDLVSMIRAILQSSQVLDPAVRVLFRETEPVWVLADEFQMEEVFTNYLTNAYHHVNERKLITVSLTKEAETVRVSVRNTGDPIPEEDIPLIWDKFYKVDKARTRAYGGSGIGLSIVKAVMEAHRQAYGAENSGDGVTFWFDVKRAPEEG